MMTTGPDREGGGGLSILVADDNAALRTAVRMMLGALGHRADEARDGLEAVEASARVGYDVVLLDVEMPVMGGLEAAGLIAGRGGPRPRVVVYSVDATERGIAGAPGVDAVLDKPVRLASLALAVTGPDPAGGRADRSG